MPDLELKLIILLKLFIHALSFNFLVFVQFLFIILYVFYNQWYFNGK